jgi:hypothetical protein
MKEKVEESEYGGNIVYMCVEMVKMRPDETIPGMGEEEQRKRMERVNSTRIKLL